MRTFMVYDFNVSLKLLFNVLNPLEFRKYCYNCCRQTAIFGAAILTEKYPEYEYSIYEGTFDDKLKGNPVHYEHAFIIAKERNSQRKLLIDLSRNQEPLVFQPVTNGSYLYPNINGYENMTLVSSEKLDLNTLLNDEVTEYLSSLKPRDFLDALRYTMEDYAMLDPILQHKVIQEMYGLAKSIEV